jgi:hypothetical protein
VSVARRCSKTACQQAAVATLTYAYAERAAVLGPLATYAEPHTYDLCEAHASRLTAPRGWDVVRLAHDGYESYETVVVEQDDLLALADALREPDPAPPVAPAAAAMGFPASGPPAPGSRRMHLRVLPGMADD